MFKDVAGIIRPVGRGLAILFLAMAYRAPAVAFAKSNINIAVIAPLSGSDAAGGEMIVRAAKMAVEDVNVAGGIKALGGTKLHLIIADSSDNPQGAITTTQRVLTENKISGALGLVVSPLTAAALPAFIRHRVPIITASTSNSLVSPTNDGYLFQISMTGSALGRAPLDYLEYLNKHPEIVHLGKISKVAILYVNTGYGQSAQSGLATLARQDGLNVVLDSAYPEDITDASPLIAKVASSGAQVLFSLSDTSDGNLILTALHSSNLHILVLGDGSGFVWPPIGKALGNKVNGLIGAALWNFEDKPVKDNPALAEIPKRYSDKYHEFMPDQAADTYASVWLLVQAIEAARSANPGKVRDALAKIDVASGPASLVGEVKFNKDGANIYARPVIVQWQGNVPLPVFPPDLATTRLVSP